MNRREHTDNVYNRMLKEEARKACISGVVASYEIDRELAQAMHEEGVM